VWTSTWSQPSAAVSGALVSLTVIRDESPEVTATLTELRSPGAASKYMA